MNQQLLEQLLNLRQRDQDTRQRLLEEGTLFDRYAEEMQTVHRENALALNLLISAHGWPGVTLVGVEGCRAAWLIAQHSIGSPALQRTFLISLQKACSKGDASKKFVALLTDRIRFNEQRPQIYGTVLDWNAAGELSCEVEDPKNLNLRRKSVGLPPFAEALEQHRAEVISEGGKPPDDYLEWKSQQLEWAKQVGWL